MKDLVGIRFHARSGQGAKTAAQFIAEAAISHGKEAQAFSEFGAERMGAPMKTYVRVDSKQIRTNEPIIDPDIVVVLDSSLVNKEILEGLDEDEILVINSKKEGDYYKKLLNYNGKIVTIDATGISFGLLGKDYPNMPILGVLVKISKLFNLEDLNKEVRCKYLQKLGKEKVDANIEAIKRGYDLVE